MSSTPQRKHEEPRNAPGMKQVWARLTVEQSDQLKAKANELGLTTSQWLRVIVKQALKNGVGLTSLACQPSTSLPAQRRHRRRR